MNKTLRRILKILAWIVACIFFIIILVLILIQIPAVQNFAKDKAVAYLQNKIKTKVEIGDLSVSFPKEIVLKNVFLEDQKHDTLLYTQELRVNIAMFGLLHHEVDVSYAELAGVNANVYRIHPDTSFNYQYIVNAFASPDTTKTTDTSGGMKFNLGEIVFKNIRTTFHDDYTGNDVHFYLGNFETNIKNFDLKNSAYHIKNIDVQNINASIRQYKPFVLNPVDTIQKVQATSSSNNTKLQLDEVSFTQIKFGYNNEVSGINAAINIGNFITHPQNINLQNLNIDLKDFQFNNSSTIIAINPVTQQAKPKVPMQTDTATGTWRVNLNRIVFANDNFYYDDNTKPHQKAGMDYSHLHIQNLMFDASNMLLTPTAYQGKISQIAFAEQSGFHLQKFQTDFLYNDTSASLQNLLLQTDKTVLKNKLVLKYASIASLSKQPGNLFVDADLNHCVLNAKDILTFAPQLAANLRGNENASLQLNMQLKGFVKNLSIPIFQLNGLSHTAINLSGNISGLPDGKNAYYNLNIAQFQTSSKDIHQLVPAKSIPSNVRIPQLLNAKGYFKGTMNQFATQLQLNSTSGNAFVNATMQGRNAYNANIKLQNLNVGYLTKQEQNVGRITLSANAKGSGFDIKTAISKFNATIQSAELKGYTYKDFVLNGNINHGDGNIKAKINDANIAFNLAASANMQQKFPTNLKMQLVVDTINMHALNLIKDTLNFHGQLLANLAQTDPDNLLGNIILDSIAIDNGRQHLSTDSIAIVATKNDTGRMIHLYSEFLKANLSGEYKLTEMGTALQQTINKYYTVSKENHATVAPQNWNMNAVFIPTPLILQLVPTIKGSDSLVMNASYNSTQSLFNASLKGKKISFGTNQLDSINIIANNDNNKLNVDAGFNHAKASGIELFKTTLATSIVDNKANIDLDLKDSKNKTQYNIAGDLAQISNGLKFSLAQDSLVLYYDKWTVAGNNFIQYDSTGILINNFNINNGGQSLSVNSTPQTVNAPIEVQFKDFKIATLTHIANQDSLLMDGVINGNAVVKNATTNPTFTSDLQINNLTYKRDTVGNLAIKVNNETANAFAADIALTGNKNDVHVTGMYYTGEGKMNLKLDVNSLNLASIKPFASGEIEDMDGILKANITVAGTINQPSVNGNINFQDAHIIPAVTGERLTLSNEAINVDSRGIHFNNFTMLDSASNKAVITGDILTTDFKNYTFNTSLDARNFTVVNAPESTDRLFYGKLNINTHVNLHGSMDAPVADASLRINASTNFTMVMPNEDPEVQGREGIVKFVDPEHPDTVILKRTIYDSLNRTQLKGLELTSTIQTDSSAKLSLIMDQSSGDALNVQGIANLAATIDRSGKISLTGAYQLTHGAYQVSLSFLKRNFIIQSGSTINWTGDPTSAQIDITAIYNVKTAPIDLVEQQLSTEDQIRYKQELPFSVNLKLEGELLKPVITFDITLPQDYLTQWPEVDLKLQQIRTDPSELNKQVFALLLLNRFVQEDPFQSGAGGTTASQLAVQSAGRLLSDQLNALAAGLVKGVDINFDINSEQDYSTGVEENRTDVNVGVSKKLLNDRLVVNVGSDIGLEGAANTYAQSSSVTGNFSVDYKLSEDGKYRLRAYRQNDYTEIVEGQVIETGVSFILTLDYDKFKELFENKKRYKKTPPKTPTSSNTTNQ